MYDAELKTALHAAGLARKHIHTNFNKALNIQTKVAYDELVTDLDQTTETLILNQLQVSFPAYNILSEESPHLDNLNTRTWVVDPLDGTANLVLGLPLVGVSIALLDGDAVVMGVVCHAISGTSYRALQGQGAFVKSKRLQVSTQNNLKKATIGHIVSFDEKLKPRALDLVTMLRRSCRRMLDTWTPSLEWTLLAHGKLDALVSLGSGRYDRLAGQLIAQEAGALVTDLEGHTITDIGSSYLLASNNTSLHEQLLDLIRPLYGKES